MSEASPGDSHEGPLSPRPRPTILGDNAGSPSWNWASQKPGAPGMLQEPGSPSWRRIHPTLGSRQPFQ